MNFIDGEDLETKLQKEGALPEEKVIEWAKQILHILDYLHNLNPPVIYRDIKPSNIMLHKDGRVMLVDFGIARVVHTDSQSQKTAIGTGGYAPVEQCRGKAEARSDLYALGATIHHLLTGIEPLPFKFEPLRKIMPSVSVELEGVIMKSLKDNLSERYSNAKEMLQALSFKKEVTVVPGKKQVVVMPKMKIKHSPVTVLKTCDYKKTSPEKIWEFEIIGEKGEFSPPCIANELIYFGASDDNFYCLNAENGNKIWDLAQKVLF
jgi:serine/threonine protein kinase